MPREPDELVVYEIEMTRREYRETMSCGDILLPLFPGRGCPHRLLGEMAIEKIIPGKTTNQDKIRFLAVR